MPLPYFYCKLKQNSTTSTFLCSFYLWTFHISSWWSLEVAKKVMQNLCIKFDINITTRMLISELFLRIPAHNLYLSRILKSHLYTVPYQFMEIAGVHYNFKWTCFPLTNLYTDWLINYMEATRFNRENKEIFQGHSNKLKCLQLIKCIRFVWW